MADSFNSEQTARSYQPPFNTQFSVFLDNRVGKLLELVDIFDGYSIRLVALSVIDSADHGVVRLITNNSDEARRLLKSHHMPYSESDVLVVKLSPPQGLADLCRCLLAAELSIHYAYPLMVHFESGTAIAFQTDDSVIACQILMRKNVELLGESDLSDSDSDPPWGPTQQ